MSILERVITSGARAVGGKGSLAKLDELLGQREQIANGQGPELALVEVVEPIASQSLEQVASTSALDPSTPTLRPGVTKSDTNTSEHAPIQPVGIFAKPTKTEKLTATETNAKDGNEAAIAFGSALGIFANPKTVKPAVTPQQPEQHKPHEPLIRRVRRVSEPTLMQTESMEPRSVLPAVKQHESVTTSPTRVALDLIYQLAQVGQIPSAQSVCWQFGLKGSDAACAEAYISAMEARYQMTGSTFTRVELKKQTQDDQRSRGTRI